MQFSNITIRNKENTIRKTFSTNAELEVVKYITYVNSGRYDMISRHDKHLIQTNIDYVTYHVKRCGYIIEQKKQNIPTIVIVVDEMELVN